MKPDARLLERAEELFCEALDLADPVARENFLDHACAGEAGLRATVDALLAAHDGAESLFAESGEALVVTDEVCQAVVHDPGVRDSVGIRDGMEEALGTRVGPYRLVELLGQGGCGTVYLAEQEKPVRRQVALKIIKLGMDTKSVIARFDAERQALAMMDHPNIARVLDMGATETGRPYFVMDLVRGTRITAFCDEHRLDVAQRLKLFAQVCFALQHAHQKGIIHRDIKPSNILVTMHDGEPRPVMIDFGIAKAVEGRLTEDMSVTSHEHFIGTPAYMSPEQAQRSRLDVDTRSDIYSLGVMLCELLTGKTSFDTARLLDAGVDELRRTLRDQEAPRPSVLLAALSGEESREIALNRREEPHKLAARLRGDLDWIVVKALEKDRDRRYQTANGLALDVRRHLEGEPVLARPPSRGYRLQKLVRRNKLAFTLGTAIAFLLAAGLAGTSVLLVREHELRREQARLLLVAERGRAVEAQLREQAEWREGVAEAAGLIYRNDFEAADRRVARMPGPPPIAEGAFVLRSLGEWHGTAGRWPEASARFRSLLSANRLDNLDSASLDLLATAVAILKSGREDDYRTFCLDVAGSFHGATDPMVIDRVLKSCLLRPRSAALIDALHPYADLAASATQARDFAAADMDFVWRCQTLALWYFRNGRHQEAIALTDRILAAGEHPLPRSSAALAIRAMALRESGQPDQARSDFERAAAWVRPRLERPLTVRDPDGGFWFDWRIAEILVGEAAEGIGPRPAMPR